MNYYEHHLGDYAKAMNKFFKRASGGHRSIGDICPPVHARPFV